jgi:hypothetical protein
MKDLFNYFDSDFDGEVSYDEFLMAVRGPMNEKRRAKVEEIFSLLDRDGSGFIVLDEIDTLYDTSNHPEVKKGAKTHKQVVQELLDGFEGYYQLKGFKDGKVSKDEFLEYYSFNSASIDNDDHFLLLLENGWAKLYKNNPVPKPVRTDIASKFRVTRQIEPSEL